MPKTKTKSPEPFVSSNFDALFKRPKPISTKPVRKCHIIVSDSDEKGNQVIKTVAIEDELKKDISPEFEEVKLGTLVRNGVHPKSLDIHGTTKLGVDSGIEELADNLRANASDYVKFDEDESK